MKFHTLDEVPVSRDDQVFKSSPVGKAIATLIFLGISAACLTAQLRGYSPRGLTHGAWIYFTLLSALVALIPFSLFRASLRPTNWLMRCNSSGLILKYRAYENWKLPADTLQAVALDYTDIVSAHLVKETRLAPDMSRSTITTTTYLTYIDLRLVNTDTALLEQHLAEERNIRNDGHIITLDYPVQVLDGGIIEIRWPGSITPNAHKALDYLARQGVKIEEKENRHTDLTHNSNTPPDETADHAKILALIKSGDEMSATKLAQQTYGYNLTDATNFIDQLASRNEDHGK